MSNHPLYAFLQENWNALLMRTAEHLALAGLATIAALIVGLALAIVCYRTAWVRGPLLSLIGLLQTVPGIALLVIMMALLHSIGSLPATATLFLFALFPIVQNTVVGLSGVSPTLEESARGMGLTHRQTLTYVRLPLALPSIVAGLRIAAVQTVGLATLAAFVGAGGLGQFINRGLFLSDTKLILLGAIPAALIAIIIDQLISLLQIAVTQQRPRSVRRLAGGCMSISTLLLAAFTVFISCHNIP